MNNSDNRQAPRKRPFGPQQLGLATLASAGLLLAACDNNDNSYGDDGMNPPTLNAASFYRANNGTDNAGTVDTLDEYAMAGARFTTGANEGLELDVSGNLVQAADGTSIGLRTVCTIAARADGASFDAGIDTEISGAATGLVNPKGIAIAHAAGYVFAANFNAMQISVFGTTAAGNVPPVAVTALPGNAWDLVYDEASDRLFVAMTNGTVGVFDGYVAGGFAGPADRTITPSDMAGAKISVNIHGIAYDAAMDRLVLSDVGDAAVATDGQLFVIADASTADGAVEPSRTIAGPESLLGNPVDVVLSGTELRVAEKSNDLVLIYGDIFTGMSGDIAADYAVASVKPESLVEGIAASSAADISDRTDATAPTAIAANSNPAVAGPTSGLIIRISGDLLTTPTSFDTGLSLESTSFDLAGNAYTSYDGGILVSNRVATSRDGESVSNSRDRFITGATTLLAAPKGIDVASALGLVFVAENGAANPGVLIFSACASGDVAPLLTLANGGGVSPWDVDYDADSDRAFVALTNGTVAVYDDVSTLIGTGTVMEDRIITPSNGGAAMAAPTNLHGIDFDPASGSLIVSDVGSAAVTDDGKIYVLPDAGMASGNVDVSRVIAGAATLLGNPVDIMFDGTDLYVAEKSNAAILRFDDLLSSAGGNVAPSESTGFVAPESVALIPAYLSQSPGE